MSIVEVELRPRPRQLFVLALHAQGYTFEQIGEQLHLSQWTVKYDLDRLRELLDARSLTHCFTICIARGMLCVDGRVGKPFVPRDLAEVA